MEGRNVILTAETGCGKTFAFLVPLLQQIIDLKPLRDRGYNRPLGLVITPSRELTFQISVSRIIQQTLKNLKTTFSKFTNFFLERGKKIVQKFRDKYCDTCWWKN